MFFLALLALCAPRAAAQQDAAALLNQARSLAASHRLDEAERALLELIGNHAASPLRADALLELSRVYEQWGRIEQAAGMLRQLYDEAPDGPMAAQALYHRARLLGNAGRREDSVEVFLHLLDRFPDSASATDARFQASAILRSLGRSDDAIRILKPLLKSAIPEDALQARRSLADIYIQIKRWHEAETELEIILAAEPGNTYYLELLARALMAQADYGRALAAHEKLYALFPGNAHYENLLFEAYEKSGAIKQKIQDLEKRADAAPPDLAAVRKLARLRLWQGNSLDALVRYETLVQHEPDDPGHAVTLARLYYENQWRDKARQTLERVLERNPNHVDAWRQLGDIHHAEGRADQARAAWEKSVQFNPADQPSYLRLGGLLMSKQLLKETTDLYLEGRQALGSDLLFTQELISLYTMQMRPRDALEEYLRLLAVDQAPPGLSATMLASITSDPLRDGALDILAPWLKRAPHARALLGFHAQVAAALDRMPAALEALNAYAAAHPGEPDIFFDTARLLLDAGRYRGAASLYLAAADRPLARAQQSAALLGAANAWLWAGRPDDASSCLERIARDFPDTPDAPEAAFRLAETRAAQNRCAEAATLFSNLLNSDGSSQFAERALLGRGRCFIALARYAEAETDLTTLWNMPGASRWFDEILYLQGESRYLQGLFSEAEAFFRRIAESFPESRFVNDALTRLLFLSAAQGVDPVAAQAFMQGVREARYGDPAQAAALLEGLSVTLKGTPLAEHALFELANARRAQGDAAGAEALFLQIADAGPESELFAPALLQAADIQAATNRPRDALRSYQRLLDQDPSGFWSHVARDRVQELLPLIPNESS